MTETNAHNRLDGNFKSLHITCFGMDRKWTLQQMVQSFSNIDVKPWVAALKHYFICTISLRWLTTMLLKVNKDTK